MYIYCIIFLVLAILAAEYETEHFKKANFFLVIIGVFLIFFTGLRDVSVSRDYYSYLLSFKTVLKGAEEGSGILPTLEPGFVWIVTICYNLFDSNGAPAVMLAFAFLCIALKLVGIKKLAVNPFLVLLLYYSQYFFIQEMTQIRNGVACSFFLLAIYFYLKGKRFEVILLILAAFLFHNSSVVYFIIFLLQKDKLNGYFFGGLLVIAAVLGILKIPFLSMLTGVNLNQVSNKLTTYVDLAGKKDYERVRFFNVLNTFNYFITAYILAYCTVKKINDTKLNIFIKCNIIGLFTYGLLLDIPSVAARFSELFGVMFSFMLASAIKLFPFNKFNILFVVIVAAIFLYINLFYGELVKPYRMIHFK